MILVFSLNHTQQVRKSQWRLARPMSTRVANRCASPIRMVLRGCLMNRELVSLIAWLNQRISPGFRRVSLLFPVEHSIRSILRPWILVAGFESTPGEFSFHQELRTVTREVYTERFLYQASPIPLESNESSRFDQWERELSGIC